MKDIMVTPEFSDRLIESALQEDVGLKAAVSPSSFEDRMKKMNEKVTNTYKITGKRRDVEKIEAIFSMINEASKQAKSNSVTLELNMTLGGSEEYNSKITVARLNSRKPLVPDADNAPHVERKATIYI